jgi:hypothetical protein
MRKILSTLILLALCLLTGCSYATHYFVANESTQTVEVRYKIKKVPVNVKEMFASVKKAPISQLSDAEKWTFVPESEYKIDERRWTLTVQLRPQEALLVARLMNDFPGKDLDIEEIGVIGDDGQIWFEGRQVKEAFSTQGKHINILTYR